MTERRWLNNTQPQTLQVAVMLLYLNAAFLIFDALTGSALNRLGLALVVGEVAGAFGVANEKKWGYVLALVAAVLPIALLFRSGGILGAHLLTLMFEVALVALLLHPQSRAYEKVWFR